ncbi:sensor domain-containing diguanylate cyclase [Lysobacter sp. A3-1-A15]|uniref:sensor domain-containing diguanylate cyclase n=1 Tax=Novilysobacter viscosus TaxID=3098602 RepID=UPI002ED7836C
MTRAHAPLRGLRFWLGLGYGAIVVGFAVALAVMANLGATRQMEREAGRRLDAQARHMAERLDVGVQERLDDVRLLALLPLLRTEPVDAGAVRRLFGELVRSEPAYAWIGFAAADGTVRVASGGLLEGGDVSARPWFQAARTGPHLGDVHEAALLARLLPRRSDGQPLRLIDTAAPVRSEEGELLGVVGAHLSWRWAERQRDLLLGPAADRSAVDIFVLDAQGRVLMGPAGQVGRTLATDSARAVAQRPNGHVAETWDDGVQYLTGYARTGRDPDAPTLGWHVLVRETRTSAMAELRDLRHTLTAVVGVLALLSVAGALLLARKIGAPLHALAEAATVMRTGLAVVKLPQLGGYREAQQLSSALSTLFDQVGRREHELRELADTLERRVEERTRELHSANDALERLSVTDSLTGLNNRRYFDNQLAHEMQRARQQLQPLSLLLVDLDHFKRINDTHGHPAGDRVLQLVADLLDQGLRPTDAIARIGGEEFAVIAAGADLAQATALGERLRRRVDGASPLEIGRLQLPISVSIGVASIWLAEGDAGAMESAAERLYTHADMALYRAKRGGRNRVEGTVA